MSIPVYFKPLPSLSCVGYADSRLSLPHMPKAEDICPDLPIAKQVKRTYRKLPPFYQRKFLFFLLEILVYAWQKEMAAHFQHQTFLKIPELLTQSLHTILGEVPEKQRDTLQLFRQQLECIQNQLQGKPKAQFHFSLNLLRCIIECCAILHEHLLGHHPNRRVEKLLQRCHTLLMSRGNVTPSFYEFYARLWGRFTETLPIMVKRA